MRSLKKSFNTAVARAALAAVLAAGGVAVPVLAEVYATSVRADAAAVRTGTTVMDLSASPNDFSSVARHVGTEVRKTLAAGRNVIIIVGEEHSTISHVGLAEHVRQGVMRAGVANPAMAREQSYNMLEFALPVFFPEESQEDLRVCAAAALSDLKNHDLSRYNRLQAMAHAAWNWKNVPAVKSEHFSRWLDSGAVVRLVDMAINENGFIDYADPDTAAFVDLHVSDLSVSKMGIPSEASEGIRLRNLWMAKQLRDIVAKEKKRVVILQTGLGHIGGNQREGWAYHDSLRAILAGDGNKNTRLMLMFPENHGIAFENYLPADAQAAMNNSDTIVLRGLNGARHQQGWLFNVGSFEDEAYLSTIESKKDYHARLDRNRKALLREMTGIVNQCAKAPLLSGEHPRPLF